MIEEFVKNIPPELRVKSGSVFYSGRSAFSGRKELYILGLNPGGDPIKQATETVEWHTREVLQEKPDRWSEYSDERWGGYPKGKKGMQPRILHLLRNLGLEAGDVPSSNIIFMRSRGESGLAGNLDRLAEACWPFHRAVIERIRPRVVLCFGGKAGNFVKKKTGAMKPVNRFVERNRRGWTSVSYSGHEGLKVVVATHPGRADWTNPNADPSGLVKRALSF